MGFWLVFVEKGIKGIIGIKCFWLLGSLSTRIQ